ncbi:protein-methionine-sulfoxide reductase heme-binding subunit MsrQ [Pseudooceanicola sp.]|uniref:protein-methionine-sulfoxide reductase heme-binding subunit MsrQ n=1 Tax=Pseudooceanicola sp. TaxID=1914328 RepID=UPI0026027452|nr:protein-methionine-sulfoxide reductase heme-binding subunit MsrQ [Pseudooceanicola sp.]MDF1857239.1 protein-methionine-sulfoxide reductase heme-binding subunit MsrQ [Pseudooceanicola sp.]
MSADSINKATRRLPAWPLYVLGALPPVWLIFSGFTGGLGIDPVKVMEHQMGEWGLWLLIAGLAVTPLQRFAGVRLIKYRRAIGVLAFFYIFLHLLIWLVLDVQIVSQIIKDIYKRPYITIGMAAFVLMIPLGLTSNNWSLRKLGPRWRKLHKLVYLIVPLGGLHFLMLVKGFQIEPLVYLTGIATLLVLRIKLQRPRRARAA